MRRMKLVWAGVISVALIVSPGVAHLGPLSAAHAAVGDPAGQRAAAGSGSTPGQGCDPDDLPGGSEGPDDDGDECNFTIMGNLATPLPNSGLAEFAQGSPAAAKNCNFFLFQGAQAEAATAGAYIGAHNAPTGSAWFDHFLGGSGTPLDALDGSPLSAAAKADPQFQAMDKAVQAEAKAKLDGGALDVKVSSSLKRIDFSSAGNSDLQLAFGGTQGLEVTGSGFPQHGRYVGRISYRIRDVYGFYPTSKFLGASKAMNYLQGTCGAPYTPGGAHWFYSSVIVTVPFSQPIG